MTARRLALACLLAILALHAAWHGWLLPPARVPVWLPIGLAILPAVPALLSWLQSGRLAPVWSGIASLVYFCHGVMEAWSAPDARILAIAEILLSVGCILASGWPGLVARQRRKAAEG